MKRFSVLIDDNNDVIELSTLPKTIQGMTTLTKQTRTEKSIQSMIKQHSHQRINNIVQHIQSTNIPIYFYALLNSAEKQYDWYIIDTAFNQMLKDQTLTFDRVDDWFAYNTLE